MPTAKEIINQGLGKIGSTRVNNLTPPISAIEVKCAGEYPQWKASELTKRRWVFATELTRLTALATQVAVPLDGRPYQFNVPGDMLRPLRGKGATWIQRGQFLYSAQDTIDLEYIRNAADAELTEPLFVDVLASRCAFECAELVTQSPARKRDAFALLTGAIEAAGRANAFVLDEHETSGDNAAYTWDTARNYPSLSGL